MNPETKTQKILLEIWQELLTSTDFGIEDNFFEVGGDSLLAHQMYDIIRSRFQGEFPGIELPAVPTIRHLASIVDSSTQGAGSHKFRALRIIQKGKEGIPPLFLVHGGTGIARIFKLLTDQLDDSIPVYAFRWNGWDGHPGDRSLKQMAQSYLNEMKHVQPEGPYWLGGYCIGGLMAVEMAEQLRLEGIGLAGSLLIWDAPNLESVEYHPREPWQFTSSMKKYLKLGQQLNELQDQVNPDKNEIVLLRSLDGAYEPIRQSPILYGLARKLQIFFGTIPFKIHHSMGRKIPVRWRWNSCMATGYLAIRKHHSMRYGGDITYFRSGAVLGRAMNLTGWWNDPYMGFGELCGGKFKGYVVGGGHVDVLADSYAARIVEQDFVEITARLSNYE